MKNSLLARYGLLGSPDGFQTSYKKIGKEFKYPTDHLDLDNSYASALPSPDEENCHNKPIIRLQRKQLKTDTNVIYSTSISWFLSTKQKGSHRSGTFYGSFVEVFNQNFSSSNDVIESIIKNLWKLSGYQLKNLIDEKTNTYHSLLKDLDFPYPNDFVQQDSTAFENLEPVEKGFSPETALIIECSPQKSVHAISLTLEAKLLTIYNPIFIIFDHELIESMRQNTRNLEVLKYNEINSLTKFSPKFLRNIELIQAQSNSIMNNVVTEHKSQYQALKHEKLEAENQLKTQINTLESESSTLKEKLQAEKKSNQIKLELTQFADAVIQETKNLDSTSYSNQTRFASKQDIDSLLNDRSALKQRIDALSKEVAITKNQSKRSGSKSQLTFWMQIVATLLIIIFMVVMVLVANNHILSPLKKQRTDLNRLSNQLEETNNEIRTLKRDLNKMASDVKKTVTSQ